MADASALIGVDWGTTSLRAYQMGADGEVLAVREGGPGVLQVEPGGFADALQAMVGDWRRPGLNLMLSGMVGSRQGWHEVPYLPVPASAADLAGALVRHPDDPLVYIVPGLAWRPASGAPDVMRGEETQIVGAARGLTG